MKIAQADVVAMVAVKDLDAAKEFYGDKLGLEQAMEGPAGIAYKSGSGTLFVYPAPTAGTNQATSANWQVDDIESVVAELKDKGITFEKFDVPGAKQEGDISVMGANMKAAWFKDPSGNILGLTQM
jgi:catechol 2,3-dioxygenase-like lactoylglutathione lyase family enzyme